MPYRAKLVYTDANITVNTEEMPYDELMKLISETENIVGLEAYREASNGEDNHWVPLDAHHPALAVSKRGETDYEYVLRMASESLGDAEAEVWMHEPNSKLAYRTPAFAIKDSRNIKSVLVLL